MTRPFVVFCMLLTILFGCQDEHSDNAATRQKEDYKPSPYVWGFIHTNGTWAIKPFLDDCRDFRENLAPAMEKGLWGYINKNGEWAIQPEYMEAHPFHKGLGRVKDQNGLFGMLNPQGDWVITPQWEELQNFNSTWALGQRNIHYRYVNTNGDYLLEDDLEQAYPFVNGIAVVKKDGKYHTLNEAGQYSPPYSRIIHSLSPPFPCQIGEGWNWVNQQGASISEVQYEEVYPFEAGYGVGLKDDIYHVIDKNGQSIGQYSDEVEPLGHGWLAVYNEANEAVGLLSLDQDSIKQIYDEIHPFSNRRAAVRKDSLWTFIRPDGEEITPPFTPMAWTFSNNYSRVILDKGIGFIDTTGRPITDMQFFEVKDFHEGLARAQWIRK